MAAGYINMTSSASSFEGRIYYTTAQNLSAKTTTISLSYQVRRVGLEGSTGGNASPYSLSTTISTSNSITNKSYTYTSGSIVVPNSGSWTTIGSSSHTITHAADGTAAMSFTTHMNGTSNGVYFSASDSIPIGSITIKPTLNSAPNFQDDDNPTITYSNPMGEGVDSLVAYILDSNNNRVVYRSDISKTGSSYTFYLTNSERNALREALGTATSMTVKFYIHAVIGGIGHSSYLSKTFSIQLNAPSITASISDTKSATNTLTGGGLRFIPGNNTMTYSMTATAQSGATITKVSVICGNQTKTTTSGTLTNIENSTVIFSATDSRGLTATKTIQLTPVEYVKLTCNQTVKMIPTGADTAQMALTVSGNFFNGSFGAKSNTLKLYARYARNGGSFTSWTDLSPLGYDASGNTYTLSTNMSGFDPSGTYTFECKAEDALMSVISNDYAATFTPVFDWSNEDFNFNVPVSIEGYLLNDFVCATGTESMGTNGTWYWRKWKSGRAECYGVRNYGNMGVSTAWGNLYRSESFAQSLPSGLFIATPEVIDITYRGANFGGWIANHEATTASTSTTGGFILVRPASATLSQAMISFNVIGRWK